jgi:site-specific recombinase XerD
MKVKSITWKVVEDLKQGQSAWAADLHGFYIRKQKSDVGTYAIMYRWHGRQRYWRVGDTQLLTPKEAYGRAKIALLKLADGQSPAHERDATRAAGTVAQFMGRYLDACDKGRVLRHGRSQKASTLKAFRSRFKHWIEPRLGPLPVNALDRGEIEKFMHAVADDSSRPNATLCVNILGGAFAWGERNGLIKVNPCAGVQKFRLETKERVLSEDEWAALGVKLVSEQSVAAAALVAFLAHSGWRRNEALNLRFEHVNQKTRLAALPDTKTGPSTRYLSKRAIAIIAAQHKLVTGDHVFPGPLGGRLAFDLPWERLKPADDLTPHALRHSYATLCAVAGGYPEAVTAALLGHTRGTGTITAGYQHVGAEPLLVAADAVSTKIDALLSGADNVVPFKGAAG